MSKPTILLIGAGGHCKSCIDVIEQEGRFQIAGIVDRPGANSPAEVLGYPLIGTDDDLEDLRGSIEHAFVTVGQVQSADVRIRLYSRFVELGYRLPAIISPNAHVSRHARVGAGTIVMHGVTVNAAASVGVNCILNSHCLIEHDAVVEDHCHVSTGAIVNGQAAVGAGSFVGSGAVVVQCEKVPPGSFVRARGLFFAGRCR
jgi:sugar O-acyltransferase (sialic acid O-acetyltransferase NeuD family)